MKCWLFMWESKKKVLRWKKVTTYPWKINPHLKRELYKWVLLSKKKDILRSKVQLNLSSNIETEAHVGTYQGNEILIPRD